MGCFSTACFGSWKHKKTLKKVHDQPLSPSDELHESGSLLGVATAESLKEEEIIIVNPTRQPISEFDQCKSGEEQMNCNLDKLVENENENSKQKTLDDNSKGEDQSCENRDPDRKIAPTRSKSSAELESDCFPELGAESSESLFSLSIDSRKQVFTADMGDKEVTSPLKPNNNYTSIGSAKSVRLMDKSPSSLKFDENDKENVNLVDMSKQCATTKENETAVKNNNNNTIITTSLSSWLNVSEKSTQKTSIGYSNSPESEKNYGPTGELKQMNGGDGQLGIGTVGRYWRQTGPGRACLAEV
ncbi:hypothetical protein PHJA_002839800 [Phtheirospermum japonicum]|uniref:Uncharacterized protein n=1 Tax=Phtheirospermum japonicum TaxID=374723 RepID=A0A830D5L1_9LAMI|nr:hypothetical protein PHJA_002839800 [Phtheirospermum japonicum]